MAYCSVFPPPLGPTSANVVPFDIEKLISLRTFCPPS